MPTLHHPINREQLIARLTEIAEYLKVDNDKEASHGEADDLLIEYINDPEIKAAYEAIDKWYA